MSHTAPVKRVLFVCRLNRHRSATAERIFCKRKDLDVRSAGTEEDALVRVNTRMIEWADVILAMDQQQVEALRRMFPSHPALDRVVSLDIPDEFLFLQPQLVELLNQRVSKQLSLADLPPKGGSHKSSS
jgi:predicted protein tyrosine phosphatase